MFRKTALHNPALTVRYGTGIGTTRLKNNILDRDFHDNLNITLNTAIHDYYKNEVLVPNECEVFTVQ